MVRPGQNRVVYRPGQPANKYTGPRGGSSGGSGGGGGSAGAGGGSVGAVGRVAGSPSTTSRPELPPAADSSSEKAQAVEAVKKNPKDFPTVSAGQSTTGVAGRFGRENTGGRSVVLTPAGGYMGGVRFAQSDMESASQTAARTQAAGFATVFKRAYAERHGTLEGYDPATMTATPSSGPDRATRAVNVAGLKPGEKVPTREDAVRASFTPDKGFEYNGERYYGQAAAVKFLELERSGRLDEVRTQQEVVYVDEGGGPVSFDEEKAAQAGQGNPLAMGVSGFNVAGLLPGKPGYGVVPIENTPQVYKPGSVLYREVNPDIGWPDAEEFLGEGYIPILSAPVAVIAREWYGLRKQVLEEATGKVARGELKPEDVEGWSKWQEYSRISQFDVKLDLDASKSVAQRISNFDVPLVDVKLGVAENAVITGLLYGAPIARLGASILMNFAEIGGWTVATGYASEKGMPPVVVMGAGLLGYKLTGAGLASGSKYLPVPYLNEVKLPTGAAIKGSQVWRGVSVEHGASRTGQPLVGFAGNKPTLGTPELEFSFKPAEGSVPGVESDYVLSARIARGVMEGQGVPKSARAPIDYQKYFGEYGQPIESLLKENTHLVFKRNNPLVFGSTAQKAQMGDLLSKNPGDVDISFGVERAESFAQTAVSRLRKVEGGRPVRVSPENPKMVEVQEGGRWKHLLDVHDISDVDMPGLNTRGYTSWAFKMPESSYRIGGIFYRRLSVEATGKMGGATLAKELDYWVPATPTETAIFDKSLRKYVEKGGTFGPKEHRLKDVRGYGEIEDALIGYGRKDLRSRLTRELSRASDALNVFKKTADAKFAGKVDSNGYRYKPFSEPEAEVYMYVPKKASSTSSVLSKVPKYAPSKPASKSESSSKSSLKPYASSKVRSSSSAAKSQSSVASKVASESQLKSIYRKIVSPSVLKPKSNSYYKPSKGVSKGRSESPSKPYSPVSPSVYVPSSPYRYPSQYPSKPPVPKSPPSLIGGMGSLPGLMKGVKGLLKGWKGKKRNPFETLLVVKNKKKKKRK